MCGTGWQHEDGASAGRPFRRRRRQPTVSVSSSLSAPGINCTLAAPAIVCALAILPAILWGISPVVVKYALSRGGTRLQALVVILTVDTAILWLATGVRHGVGTIFSLSPVALGIFAVAGLLGTAVGRIVVYTGIDRLGAAINTACLSTRPLFATVLGVVALGEWVGPLTVLGVVTLAAGLAVLALSRGGDVSGWQPKDLVFPVTGAALYAIANVIRRSGLRTTAASPLEAVTVNETVALVIVLGYVLARGRADELAGPTITYPLFALAGALAATGMISLFIALGHPAGRIVIVDPLVAAAPLVTTVAAYFLLRDVEEITRGIGVGTAMIVTGAVLVIVG